MYRSYNDSLWSLVLSSLAAANATAPAFIMHNLYTKLRGHPYIRLEEEEEEEGVENPVHDKRLVEIIR